MVGPVVRRLTDRDRILACPAAGDAPPPGVALVATLRHGGGPGLTLMVDWRDVGPFLPGVEAVPVVKGAHRAVRMAAHAGWAAAPLVRVCRPPRYPFVYRVADGAGRLEVVDGPSLGLAAAWSAASWVAQRSVPAHHAAVGAVAVDGRVLPVDGVTTKVRMLVAAGVTTVWTSSCQVEEAMAAGVEACGVDSVGELVLRTLPAADAEGYDERLVRCFVQWAGSGSPAVSDWSPLERTLAALGSRAGWGALPDLGEALSIVRRHLDRTSVPLRPLGLECVPRPLRLRRVAHHLQAHADHGTTGPDELLPWALGFVAEPLERSAADLYVLGAAGRLLACHGRLEGAWTCLADAVAGYDAMERPVEMGRSVCGLLWLASVVPGRTLWVNCARARAARLALEDLDAVGREHLSLAEGRMQVRLGQEPTALASALASRVDHVRDSARRWARRWTGEGPWPSEGSDYWWLAALDAALRAGDDPRPAVEGLRGLRPRRVAQVEAWRERPRQLADAWPY